MLHLHTLDRIDYEAAEETWQAWLDYKNKHVVDAKQEKKLTILKRWKAIVKQYVERRSAININNWAWLIEACTLYHGRLEIMTNRL